MEGAYEFRALEIVHAAAQSGNGRVGRKKCLRREASERDDDFGRDRGDLAEEKRLARRDLVRLRVPVFGRPALDYVRDVDVIALQPDRLDDLREELAGAADEWNALNVFVMSRAPRRRT